MPKTIKPFMRKEGRVVRERMYKFIIEYKMDNDGVSPSYREIMEKCEVASTSVVHYHLAYMQGQGLILQVPGQRTIQVVGGKWLPPTELPTPVAVKMTYEARRLVPSSV